MNGLARLVRPLPPINIVIARSPIVLASGLRLTLSLNPIPLPSRAGSKSRAGRYHAMLDGAPSVGVDIETIGRVAANATAEDDWLAPDERLAVKSSPSPVHRITCHWVLKEAYGKAIGVGLALPLADLVFTAEGPCIALNRAGRAAPNWEFLLYGVDDLIVGIARRQVTTPLAPAGRKPPMLSLDR